MRRLRPTEVKAVAAILDDPADDVTELATRIIRTVDELRENQKKWCVIVLDGLSSVYGPYDSVKVAMRDVSENVVNTRTEPVGAVLRVLRSTDLEVDDE